MDLVDTNIRVKDTNLVNQATGNFYHWKALESLKYSSAEESLAYVQSAIEKFEECLLCDPVNPQVFIYLFVCLYI